MRIIKNLCDKVALLILRQRIFLNQMENRCLKREYDFDQARGKKHRREVNCLFLGSVSHPVFYAEEAAETLCRALHRPVAAEELTLSKLRADNSSVHNLPFSHCWVFESFFVELGVKPAFGYFDNEYFYNEMLTLDDNFCLTIPLDAAEEENYIIFFRHDGKGQIHPVKLQYDNGRISPERFTIQKFSQDVPFAEILEIIDNHQRNIYQ